MSDLATDSLAHYLLKHLHFGDFKYWLCGQILTIANMICSLNTCPMPKSEYTCFRDEEIELQISHAYGLKTSTLALPKKAI